MGSISNCNKIAYTIQTQMFIPKIYTLQVLGKNMSGPVELTSVDAEALITTHSAVSFSEKRKIGLTLAMAGSLPDLLSGSKNCKDF